MYVILVTINGSTGLVTDKQGRVLTFKKQSAVKNFARNQELPHASAVELVDGTFMSGGKRFRPENVVKHKVDYNGSSAKYFNGA